MHWTNLAAESTKARIGGGQNGEAERIAKETEEAVARAKAAEDAARKRLDEDAAATAKEAEDKRKSLQGRAAVHQYHKALAEGDAMVQQEVMEQNAQLAGEDRAARRILRLSRARRSKPWYAIDDASARDRGRWTRMNISLAVDARVGRAGGARERRVSS